MSFEIRKMHKWEENIEREVTDGVFEFVCEHYGIDEVEDLTKEQIEEVREFWDGMNEYSPIYIGFSNLFNYLEDIIE
jgi:hypothetical protein